jgi:hypothetical protein
MDYKEDLASTLAQNLYNNGEEKFLYDDHRHEIWGTYPDNTFTVKTMNICSICKNTFEELDYICPGCRKSLYDN